MNYFVNNMNNFCRIFEMPYRLSSEYCFNGGIDTNFKMVDWFNPMRHNVSMVGLDYIQYEVFEFLSDKKYIEDGKKYLFLSDFGACFVFDKQMVVNK